MANIPGAANALPGSYVEVETRSRGASIPGGIRIAAIIGEGSRNEVIVSSALGEGRDGLNSEYSSTNGSDGRHFALSLYPVVSGRTKLYKNGVLLSGLEDDIDGYSFSNLYDYRIDSSTGRIELQTAYIVNQGGLNYKAVSSNVGQGSIQNLSVSDTNAPTETWTIKCVSVQRDVGGSPIDKSAKFIAFGSVSGTQTDALGNPILWVANNSVVDNGIIKFSILEEESMGSSISPFREGDTFTVKVKSGVLLKNDTLTATYIAESDLNDPTFFISMSEVQAKHGLASTENTLSLGCQLAFDNGAPGIMCVQAAPSIPKRSSYDLIDSFNASSSDVNEFVLPLPVGVTPDSDSEIHFFVTNPATGVETQVIPNKFEFYTLGTSGKPSLSTFVNDNTSAPTGYAYSYTVIKDDAALNFGSDGYINANQVDTSTALFSSSLVEFDSSYVGKNVLIENANNASNVGEFEVLSVLEGKLLIKTTGSDFITESSLVFEVRDPDSQSDYVVLNKNVVPNGYSVRATLITDKDATFYDAGWSNALESLELVEVDIVVPLPLQTKSVIFQNALSHCRTMSTTKNKKERVLLTGAISGLKPDHILGTKLAAVEDIGVLEGIQGDEVNEVLTGNTEDLASYSVTEAFGNTFRCVYFYPDEIVVQAGTSNVVVDGFYAAAAAAGYLSATTNVSIPLTNKTLSGFSILKTKQFKNEIVEQLASAGVTVLKPVTGGANVIWGKTTTQSGFPEEEEISIVFIRDRVAKTLRAGFAGFAGNPESDETPLTMSARAVVLLNSLVSQKLITAWKDLKVVRDSSEPRQWNIVCRVQPTYPVNWIYIKVDLGLI